MKKFAANVLVLSAAAILTACGGISKKAEVVSTAAENSSSKTESDFSGKEGSSDENKVSDPNVIIDNDLFKVTLIGKLEKPDIGYSVLIENKSDQYIKLDIRNSSVDGLMTGLYFDSGNSDVSPGKKLKTEIRVLPADLEENPSIDLKNVEGSFTIATNTDGGLHWTGLRDAYPFVIPDNEAGAEAGVDAEGETGGEKIETIAADDMKQLDHTKQTGDVEQTSYVKIEGIYVDNSYTLIANPKKLVYVFTDMFTNAENLQVCSESSELTINGTNSYSSIILQGKAQPMSSYYYNKNLKDVYIGESRKVLLTFLVPAAELEAGRSITMDLYGIPDADKIKMNTDEIVFCNSEDEIAEKADPDGYVKTQPADDETTKKVKQEINGHTFSVNFGNSTTPVNVEYEFESPNKFKISYQGSRLNGGAYSVEKGYLACKFDATLDASGNKIGEGTTTRIPWEWGSNGIELDFSAVFE